MGRRCENNQWAERQHMAQSCYLQEKLKALENTWVNLLSKQTPYFLNSSVITPKWGSVNNVCSEWQGYHTNPLPFPDSICFHMKLELWERFKLWLPCCAVRFETWMHHWGRAEACCVCFCTSWTHFCVCMMTWSQMLCWPAILCREMWWAHQGKHLQR